MSDSPKDTRFEFQAPAVDMQKWRAAAEADGRSFASWLRKAAAEKLERQQGTAR